MTILINFTNLDNLCIYLFIYLLLFNYSCPNFSPVALPHSAHPPLPQCIFMFLIMAQKSTKKYKIIYKTSIKDCGVLPMPKYEI